MPLAARGSRRRWTRPGYRSFVRARLIPPVLIGLGLIGLGWFGGGSVGFVAGIAVGWIVSVLAPPPVSVLGFAFYGSLLVGAAMAISLPAAALYHYRSRSN
jgi:hypothetical protein